jgi:hypothetical protein
MRAALYSILAAAVLAVLVIRAPAHGGETRTLEERVVALETRVAALEGRESPGFVGPREVPVGTEVVEEYDRFRDVTTYMLVAGPLLRADGTQSPSLLQAALSFRGRGPGRSAKPMSAVIGVHGTPQREHEWLIDGKPPTTAERRKEPAGFPALEQLAELDGQRDDAISLMQQIAGASVVEGRVARSHEFTVPEGTKAAIVLLLERAGLKVPGRNR